jgi:hypothetical protein
MENQIQNSKQSHDTIKDHSPKSGNSCNVNSTFNNTVGVVAIAAFCIIAYFAYNYFKR